MLALLFSFPCFPCFSTTAAAVEREREKGNFSIAEAVRQRTREGE